jgi:cytochrome bd ubiquinol oxidase subunit II
MTAVWFALVASMLTAYAVLDGFDLGAGAIHLLVARTEEERRLILRSIGPVWDGNEVWLVAAGGTLFFAFPALYASSFSGFYLPLNIVLWLLMFRAVGIEFRSHVDARVWRDFFDGAFGLSSALLAIFFGAALGNVIRGVPLQPDGTFFEPLWTNWRVGADNGILDWYTVLCALLVLAAVVVHGMSWVALKTEGALRVRSRLVAIGAMAPVVFLSLITLVATISIRPQLLANYRQHAVGIVIPVAVVASVASFVYFWIRGRDLAVFLSSCAFMASMLAGVAFALYPRVLPASTNDAYSLTIYNTAAGPYSLNLGVYWWSAGMVIAIVYFVVVYSSFKGKVRVRD